MTNLDQMKDEEGNLFTPASQRACLIIHQLQKFVEKGEPWPSQRPTSCILGT